MVSSLVVPTCLLLLWPLLITSMGDNMIGPGLWRVVSVGACAQEHAVGLRVERRKINRTHDGFSASIDSDEDIDDSYAVRVDICKRVDGGCKPYQVLADESLPRFVRKYAADNARAFLASAGLDPPDFPVPKGSYSVRNFVFDYSELPAESIYGEFGAAAYLLRGEDARACLMLDLDFSERGGNESDDDDDDDEDDR